MTEIFAALEALFADTPQPVTVWGVRFTDAGHIAWCDDETEARSWLAEEQAAGCPAELVYITGHVRTADDAATGGGAR